MPQYVVDLPIRKTIQVRNNTVAEIRALIEKPYKEGPRIYVTNLYVYDEAVDGIQIGDEVVPDGHYVVILDVPGDGVAVAAYNEEEFANALISSN